MSQSTTTPRYSRRSWTNSPQHRDGARVLMMPRTMCSYARCDSWVEVDGPRYWWDTSEHWHQSAETKRQRDIARQIRWRVVCQAPTPRGWLSLTREGAHLDFCSPRCLRLFATFLEKHG